MCFLILEQRRKNKLCFDLKCLIFGSAGAVWSLEFARGLLTWNDKMAEDLS